MDGIPRYVSQIKTILPSVLIGSFDEGYSDGITRLVWGLS